MNIIREILNFLSGVKVELNNVSWLKREQVVATTANVLSLAIIISVFLFGLDLIFEKILILLIGH